MLRLQPAPKLPIYAMAPMTGRDGRELAAAYDYPSVEAFARAIPLDAKVADIGAGSSTLGLEICRIRGDIEWNNIDLRYKNPKLAARLSKGAPANLSFIPANVVDLGSLGPDRYDRIFTHYVLDYIKIEGYAEARTAARNMLSLLNPDGELCVASPFIKSKEGKEYKALLASVEGDDVDIDNLSAQIVAGLAGRAGAGKATRFLYTLGHAFYPKDERLTQV